ncbi:XRE family transcriptional regulator [Leadbetterella sp. DM7]|uniref:XRE family transcriptional regulator n=1 Tax=Leadbetterella sp. DM7 TaxID=3235085 RepID=UPI00349E609E
MEPKIHEGRNVKRFREMLGIKQEALAHELGEDWNQKKVSLMEQKSVLEPEVLYQVAKALKIPDSVIKNFDEEKAITIIANTVNNNDHSSGNALFNYYPTINPLEKMVQLHEEKINLYERMLREKDEMMLRLEKLIGRPLQ